MKFFRQSFLRGLWGQWHTSWRRVWVVVCTHQSLQYLTINCDAGQHSQFLRCLLQYCIFFFIGMNFSFGWQCLSNSLYSFGAPKAFPGLLKRSSWPTSQKFIYFSWNLHLIIFMRLKFRFFLNSCCEIGWKSKSIANIFNIYEYIWSMHKINDKSWS